jgi:hypothetical protein
VNKRRFPFNAMWLAKTGEAESGSRAAADGVYSHGQILAGHGPWKLSGFTGYARKLFKLLFPRLKKAFRELCETLTMTVKLAQ